jgi:hypothetical protein
MVSGGRGRVDYFAREGGRSYQCDAARAGFGLCNVSVGFSSSSQCIKPKSCRSLLSDPQSATVAFVGFFGGRKKPVNDFRPFVLVTAAATAVNRSFVVDKFHRARSSCGGVEASGGGGFGGFGVGVPLRAAATLQVIQLRARILGRCSCVSIR